MRSSDILGAIRAELTDDELLRLGNRLAPVLRLDFLCHERLELLETKTRHGLPVYEEPRRLVDSQGLSVCHVLLHDCENLWIIDVSAKSLHVQSQGGNKLPDHVGVWTVVIGPSVLTCKQQLQGLPVLALQSCGFEDLNDLVGPVMKGRVPLYEADLSRIRIHQALHGFCEHPTGLTPWVEELDNDDLGVGRAKCLCIGPREGRFGFLRHLLGLFDALLLVDVSADREYDEEPSCS